MKYRKCEICGIKSARIGGTKRYFMARYPLDEDRCKKWVQVTGKEDLAYIPIEKLHQLKFVCGKHFKDRDYSKSKTQLKKFAVPSLWLTAKPLSDEILNEFPCHIFGEHLATNKDTSACENLSAHAPPSPPRSPSPPRRADRVLVAHVRARLCAALWGRGCALCAGEGGLRSMDEEEPAAGEGWAETLTLRRAYLYVFTQRVDPTATHVCFECAQMLIMTYEFMKNCAFTARLLEMCVDELTLGVGAVRAGEEGHGLAAYIILDDVMLERLREHACTDAKTNTATSEDAKLNSATKDVNADTVLSEDLEADTVLSEDLEADTVLSEDMEADTATRNDATADAIPGRDVSGYAERVLPCRYCDEDVPVLSLSTHQAACSGRVRAHECDYCAASFHSRRRLEEHERRRHRAAPLPARRHACGESDRRFSSQLKLQKHSSLHGGHACLVCDVVCKTVEQLEEHKEAHSTVVCERCGSIINRKHFGSHASKHRCQPLTVHTRPPAPTSSAAPP